MGVTNGKSPARILKQRVSWLLFVAGLKSPFLRGLNEKESVCCGRKNWCASHVKLLLITACLRRVGEAALVYGKPAKVQAGLVSYN